MSAASLSGDGAQQTAIRVGSDEIDEVDCYVLQETIGIEWCVALWSAIIPH